MGKDFCMALPFQAEPGIEPAKKLQNLIRFLVYFRFMDLVSCVSFSKPAQQSRDTPRRMKKVRGRAG
jgi:hypothetical protein